MLSYLYIGCLVIVGVINTLPVVGMLGADRINAAYGLTLNSPDLEILLRHRALLFGIIGGFILASIAIPPLRLAALILAGISMVGFLIISWQVGGANAELQRIAQVDIIGIAALVGAVALHAVLAR